jgi:hypothetical protein
MILLYVYLTISIITLLQFLFAIMDASAKLKKRYPNILYDKTSFVEVINTGFRLILLSFMPIIHIVMSLTMLFEYDNFIESAISKVYEKYKNQLDKEN